jgi:hypothetical protein
MSAASYRESSACVGGSLHAMGERLQTMAALQGVAIELVDRLMEDEDSPRLCNLFGNLSRLLALAQSEMSQQGVSLVRDFSDARPNGQSSVAVGGGK